MNNLLSRTIQKMLIFGVLCVFTQQIYAQSQFSVIKVNDKDLMNKIKQQYKEIQNNKEFGIEKLRQNIINLKNTDKADVKLPKPNKKILTAPTIYNECIKSTLVVITAYKYPNVDSVMVGKASGAILNEDGICITNYHVLESLIENKISHEQAFYVGTIDGNAFPIVNILSYSKEADAAIFKINTLGKKLQPIALDQPAEVGADVYSLSHPQSEFFFFGKGMVARNVSYGKDKPMKDRTLVTADYAVGSSGGPIINDKGNLVGLISSTQSIYANNDGVHQKNLQMVLKIIIPISSINMLF